MLSGSSICRRNDSKRRSDNNKNVFSDGIKYSETPRMETTNTQFVQRSNINPTIYKTRLSKERTLRSFTDKSTIENKCYRIRIVITDCRQPYTTIDGYYRPVTEDAP